MGKIKEGLTYNELKEAVKTLKKQSGEIYTHEHTKKVIKWLTGKDKQ